MRRQQLIGWIVAGGLAASACSGAWGARRRDPAERPDRPVRLQGSVTIAYGPQWSGCYAEPRTGEVESRIVEIRDDEGDLVAAAITGPGATLSSPGHCSAEARFETHLPRRRSYTFKVQGVRASGEPVSFDYLKSVDFECPLTIVTVSESMERYSQLSCIRPKYVVGVPYYPDLHW